MALRNSRTLPGHVCTRSCSRASSEMPAAGTPMLRPTSSRNASARTRMSSGRSRSGGRSDLKDTETVVEIFAERARPRWPCADRGWSRPRCARRPGSPRPADALKFALLQHAQELGLHGGRHLPHLVEEQHAARRLFDLSRPRVDSAGIRAALVPEQFRLEQLFRERRAVERRKRSFRAFRPAVNVARDHFLARARLPGDQNRRVGRRHLRRVRERLLPEGRRADRAVRAQLVEFAL